MGPHGSLDVASRTLTSMSLNCMTAFFAVRMAERMLFSAMMCEDDDEESE